MSISPDNLKEPDHSNDKKLTSWYLDVPRITEIVDAEIIASCLEKYISHTKYKCDDLIRKNFTREALSLAVYEYTEQENVPFLNELLKNSHRLTPGTIFKYTGIFNPGGPSNWRDGTTDLHCINSILFNGERLEIQYGPEFVTNKLNYGQISGKREFLVVAEIKVGGALGVTARPLIIAAIKIIQRDPKTGSISNEDSGNERAIIDYSGKNKHRRNERNELWQKGINALKEKDKSIKTHRELCVEYKKRHPSIALFASTIERNTSSPFHKKE